MIAPNMPSGRVIQRAGLIWLLVISTPLFAEQSLAPFTSDGCSVFPDGTWQQNQLWLPCCIAHDLAYWQGGDAAQRSLADLALKQCVSRIGEGAIAAIMLAGVRVGGSPYLPTPFRWGYGWREFRGYQALTPAETATVASILATNPAQIQITPSQQLFPFDLIKEKVPQSDNLTSENQPEGQ